MKEHENKYNLDDDDCNQEKHKEETEVDAHVYYNFVNEAIRHNQKHVIWKNQVVYEIKFQMVIYETELEKEDN